MSQLPPGYLTPHFSLAELTFSRRAMKLGISNQPGPEALKNLHRLAALMEEVRSLLGNVPVLSLSGFRSSVLNEFVNGANDSDHIHGLADDFHAPRFGSPLDICRRLAAERDLGFAQLIYEGTWVHISAPRPGLKPRREVLTAVFSPNRKRPTYQIGLPK
jgi:hypothetical protein